MKFTWGHGILVFFAIFFTWIISFVVFSLGENNDLVTKDYYRQGAEYSVRMEIDKRSSVYKDSIAIENDANGVRLHLETSLAKNGMEKQIYFYRPSNKKDDLSLLMAEGQETAFIKSEILLKGRYKVQISWGVDEGKHIVSKDFMVQ